MGTSQTFAKNVCTYCKNHNIDVGDVMEQVGHSRTYLNKPKRGEGRITLEDALATADILGTYVSALLCEGEYTKEDLA